MLCEHFIDSKREFQTHSIVQFGKIDKNKVCRHAIFVITPKLLLYFTLYKWQAFIPNTCFYLKVVRIILYLTK